MDSDTISRKRSTTANTVTEHLNKNLDIESNGLKRSGRFASCATILISIFRFLNILKNLLDQSIEII